MLDVPNFHSHHKTTTAVHILLGTPNYPSCAVVVAVGWIYQNILPVKQFQHFAFTYAEKRRNLNTAKIRKANRRPLS